MINPLRDVVLARRREVAVSDDLTGLAGRLQNLLTEVRRRAPEIPTEKALLSRDGGVCSTDGARLRFDPFTPHEHRCDVCGASYTGRRHHRAWIWRYHLWLSERMLHAALLSRLDRSASDNIEWASDLMRAYADRYRSYPNRDNVLGPTRLFFSTYMESIWLLQLIIAALILSDVLAPTLVASLESMIAESSDLIVSFDEGLSNRQVWNATASLAAGLFLGDERRVDHALIGPSGIESLLRDGTGNNGRWHEGENYHLFALRGFLLAAELAAGVDRDLYRDYPRLSQMFTAPLTTMLPDLTLAARGDSPYGVSICQPRFAELWEVGLARTGDERLAAVLARLYQTSGERHDIGLAEIAEVEQHRPAMAVTRTDLGWKALLWMNDMSETDTAEFIHLASVVVHPDGPIVIRTHDERYVCLEGAGTGSGHGHPDRLHLSLYDRGPILMDFGTGSYVDESLHWYRSWRSHNVPERIDGDGRAGNARCIAYDRAGTWQWCRATLFDFAGEGSAAHRSVVVGPEYVVDIVEVDVQSDIVVDLPIHVLGYRVDLPDAAESTGDLAQRTAPYGYERVHSLVPERGELFLPWRDGETVRVVDAPGPPPLDFGRADSAPYVLRRCRGPGWWVQVFGRNEGHLQSVVVNGWEVSILTQSGRDTIRAAGDAIEIDSDGETTRLAGFLPPTIPAHDNTPAPRPTFPCPILETPPSSFDVERMLQSGHVLNGRHYRRSEDAYRGSEYFCASWCMYCVDARVFWVINVHKTNVFFRSADARDPMLDNESPDIHSDGVQVYFGNVFDPRAKQRRWHDTWQGYVIVPDSTIAAGARVRAVPGLSAGGGDIEVRVVVHDGGYRVMASVDIGTCRRGLAFPFTFVVNEMYEGRERRAGQLALGGPGWVYLRGDRESPDTAAVGIFS